MKNRPVQQLQLNRWADNVINGFVKSPDHKIYEIVGLRKFSREHKLDPSTLSKLCDGTFKQYKGWVKYDS